MKNIKLRSLSVALVIAMMSTIFVGCSDDAKKTEVTPTDKAPTENVENDSKTRIVKDSLGREVEIPKNIEKVVTLGPVGVLNCFVFAMGEGDKIASGLPPSFAKGDRWKYHSIFYPEIANNIVVEDSEKAIIMEKLIEVDPDIVLTMDLKTAEAVEDKGMKAIVLDWEVPEDVKEVVNILGDVFNKPEKAKEYSDYFDQTIAKVNDVVSKIPQDQRVTVLNGGLENLSMGHTIAEWWIESAGGISVTKEARVGDTSTYSMEDLFNWNPDVLIVQNKADIDFAYNDERLKDINAVKNKKVYESPVMGHVWANRTMEQPLTVLWAAKLFYPEEMKGIDMKEELKTFSKKFFGHDLTDEEYKDLLGDMK